MDQEVALQWIKSLQKRTIKNISHATFVQKYADFTRRIDDCILILQGLEYNTKRYFFIRILKAMYEPFSGPHYVQIGNDDPFWVHSLTAFRREFFGITDKLSFERSVFLCLSDGEVVRLKIVRPYLKVPTLNEFTSGMVLHIYKSPSHSFRLCEKEYNKHKIELYDKREVSQSAQTSVRMRVRSHLTSSIQQLFCSYMRDYAVVPEVAYQWFLTDINYSIQSCSHIFSHLTRVNLCPQITGLHETKHTIATLDINEKIIDTLKSSMSSPNYDVIKVIHDLKHHTSSDVENSIALLTSSSPAYLPTLSLFDIE